MEKIKLIKDIVVIVKGQPIKEKANPKKAEIEKDKTEYTKLKNDRERIDFLASKLGVL